MLCAIELCVSLLTLDDAISLRATCRDMRAAVKHARWSQSHTMERKPWNNNPQTLDAAAACFSNTRALCIRYTSNDVTHPDLSRFAALDTVHVFNMSSTMARATAAALDAGNMPLLRDFGCSFADVRCCYDTASIRALGNALGARLSIRTIRAWGDPFEWKSTDEADTSALFVFCETLKTSRSLRVVCL
jgi:hypothetical protein